MTLYQYVQNNPVLINHASQPMLLAVHRDHVLVAVLLVIKSTGRSAVDVGGKVTPEFLNPGTDRLVRKMMPRSARRSSTMRKLSGNLKYSQTTWAITPGGNRWR